MKVKILLVQEVDVVDGSYSPQIVREGVTDWEEISDEDFAFLKKNIHRLYPIVCKNLFYGYKLILATQDDEPLVNRIASIKEVLEKEKKTAEDYKKKQAAAALKRKKANAAKRVEKLKAELEELEKLRPQ